MRKTPRVPTLIALIILLLGITFGVFFINRGLSFSVQARPEIAPQQVKTTNISESGFTVSWITEEAISGFISYGKDSNLSFTGADDRDQLSNNQGQFLTHHVTLRNLSPGTSYYFQINSGGKSFDNNGQAYQAVTAPKISSSPPANDMAYGTIINQSGSPAEGVIVYLSLPNVSPVSTLSKSSGSWVIPLNLARTVDLGSYAAYDKELAIEEIFVQGGSLGTSTAVTITKADSPVATLTLGQTYDFRKTPAPEEPGRDSSLRGSGFTGNPLVTPPATLSISNPTEKEDLNTTRPEFFGSGPVGETVTIEVKSDQVLTDRKLVKEDGTWSWVPPTDLAVGEHTITVSLPNGRKIIRNFTVMAAEEGGALAFTATPSATLTPTVPVTPTPTTTLILTPTPTPTPTTAGRTSLPSTESGVPRPGLLTPTLMFTTMGIALIVFGLIKKILIKKDYA